MITYGVLGGSLVVEVFSEKIIISWRAIQAQVLLPIQWIHGCCWSLWYHEFPWWIWNVMQLAGPGLPLPTQVLFKACIHYVTWHPLKLFIFKESTRHTYLTSFPEVHTQNSWVILCTVHLYQILCQSNYCMTRWLLSIVSLQYLPLTCY